MPEPLTPAELTALRAAAEKATPRPWAIGWAWNDEVRAKGEIIDIRGAGNSHVCGGWGMREATGRYIVAAANLAPLLADEVQRLRTEETQNHFKILAAEKMADEVAALITRRVVGSRSAVADAMLDYRDPPRTDRSDKLAMLEAEVQRLTKDRDDWMQKFDGVCHDAAALDEENQRLRQDVERLTAEAKRQHHLIEYTKGAIRSVVLDVAHRIGPAATPEWVRRELERIADGPNLRPVTEPEATL